MSSHHFVKEGQEPALLVLSPIHWERVASLFEWSPLVILTEDTWECAPLWGIKADVVIAPQEKMAKLQHHLSDQGPIQYIPSDSLQSQILSALAFLKSNNQKGVTIVSNYISDLLTLPTNVWDGLTVSILDNDLKWSLIQNKQFEKWMPANTSVKVANTMPQQTVNVSGLSAAHGDWLSEKDGLIRITSDHCFWVGES